MTNSDFFQQAIERINSEGYEVLQVLLPNDSSLFFLIHKFQESYQAATASVDFNSVQGINITKFLNLNVQLPEPSMFVHKLRAAISEGVVSRVQFSKDISWIKWSTII